MRKEIGGKGRKRKGKCLGWGELWVIRCDVDDEENIVYTSAYGLDYMSSM